jgi:hypothetical protein
MRIGGLTYLGAGRFQSSMPDGEGARIGDDAGGGHVAVSRPDPGSVLSRVDDRSFSSSSTAPLLGEKGKGGHKIFLPMPRGRAQWRSPFAKPVLFLTK